MNKFLTFCSGLTFHRFDIRILAEQSTLFEAWPGAILRNNLLFAAAQANIPDKGTSLFEYSCKQLPISISHPLYKEMEQGFPPPFYLYPLLERSDYDSGTIRKNEVVTFSLVLVGAFCGDFPYFVQAIQYMCRKGLGVGSKPFTLLDVREIAADGKSRLLFSGEEMIADSLFEATTLDSFKSVPHAQKESNVRIVFETPLSLIKQKKRPEKAGFQEKSNGFPGFYQLVRSAAYRLEKLTALYGRPDDIAGYCASHEELEPYLEEAALGVWMEEASLRYVTLQSTRKEGIDSRIPLNGYVGETVFSGNYGRYLPVLRCIEQLGVGEKLSYGLGKIRVEEYLVRSEKKWFKKEAQHD